MSPAHHDIAIAGGGMVGVTAALALARSGFRVALCERERPVRRQGRLGFDTRTVALNHASTALLTDLGVWDALERCDYRHVEVWEEAGDAVIEFHAHEAGVDSLGSILEVSAALERLWAAAESEANIDCLFGELSGVHLDGGEVVELQLGERRLQASLLLAADGADSSVRRSLGVPARIFPTPHSAIATVAETARPHGARAYQRFLREGPIALLPLPGRDGRHFCSVIWSQSRTEAERRMELDETGFRAALEWASDGRLGAIGALDQRVSFVLRQQLSTDFAPAHRVVLIGDAAHVLHPLAGQGVNLGLEDVAELRSLVSALPVSALGDVALWRSFARRRRLRARLMMGAMDAFRLAYAAEMPLLRWLRNGGVRALDGAEPIKRQLIREALGIGPWARSL